jgi:hypothetical protein
VDVREERLVRSDVMTRTSEEECDDDTPKIEIPETGNVSVFYAIDFGYIKLK